jgi:protein O-GlcNAcase/histone acetyltransferase
MCGVVEGFYGRPWNARQRHQLFGWMKSWGLNTYLYAPKDDLKHRLFWRDLYHDAQATEMAALIRDCQRHELNFIYAIAPGLDSDYSSKKGEVALREKAGQLIELGCRNFALLFDDIVPARQIDLVKRAAKIAAEQARFANTFLTFVREKSVGGQLLFCPTTYCGRMAAPVRHSAYLYELGRVLDPAIQVLWTGPEVVSEKIPVESIKELVSVLHRKPIIWDNLHANDYDMRRFYLGPYSGRPLELRAEAAGILSNPNCEFEVNFVPLRTLAMYVQATDQYEPRKAYLSALKEWLPSWEIQTTQDPAVVELAANPMGFLFGDLTALSTQLTVGELELLGDCFYLPFEHGQRAESLLANVQFLLQTPLSTSGESDLRLLEHSVAFGQLAVKVTALRNRDLLYAIYRHVWELKEELHLLVGYLSWLTLKPGVGESFTSVEHRPKTYRGGFVADLQRLLPMDDGGGFNHRSLIPPTEPHGDC